MKKGILLLILIITLSFPVTALQQTAGELISNITVGNSSIMKYGLRNEENTSITVKFNITGNVSDYIEYPKELELEPSKLTYIELKTTIPVDYNGNDSLRGTIYALKEGSKGGQVQLNIRLGKNINLNVIKPDVKEQTTDGTSYAWIIGVITLIAIVLVAVVMNRKSKSEKYKIKDKEVENK